MSWTYSPTNVASDVTDEVHFLIGDTDPLDPLLQNEEVDYLVALYPKPTGKPAYLAAAAACDAVASKFARKMDSSVGDLQASAEQQYNHYLQLGEKLRLAWATEGEGNSGSASLRLVPAAAVLGGGGRTYLGENTLHTGGAL